MIFKHFLKHQLKESLRSTIWQKQLILNIIIGIFMLLILITISSGVYPSLYLTKFHPVKILKGKVYSGSHHARLRNTLIVIQFTISIALIASTFIIYNQLHFLTNHDLGFTKENIITIR